MVVDKTLQTHMTKFNLHQFFRNIVHENDPVPRILNILETVNAVKKNGKLVCCPLIISYQTNKTYLLKREIGGIISILVEIFGGEKMKLAANLLESFKSFFEKNSPLMKEFANLVSPYEPVGTYCFLRYHGDIPHGKKWEFQSIRAFTEVSLLLNNIEISNKTIFQVRILFLSISYRSISIL